MAEPLLSIIIPVYKVETFLPACVNSILEQSFSDFELILVDDGSPDLCGMICDEYAAKDSRIKVIHKTNGGLSSARNAGIDSASGQYLTFVDSDDTVSAETYSKNLSLLQKDPSIDLLEYPIFVHYQSSRQYLLEFREKQIRGKEPVFQYWMKSKGYLHTYACNKIYKNKLFEQIRFPEGKTFEDIYTIPQILRLSDHVYWSPFGIYYYYSRSSSITCTASFKDLLCLLEANIRILDLSTTIPGTEQYLPIHYLYTVNTLIDLLRCKDGDPVIKNRMFMQLSRHTIKLPELIKLDIPLKMKLKNFPLAASGLKTHCLIYAGLYKPSCPESCKNNSKT